MNIKGKLDRKWIYSILVFTILLLGVLAQVLYNYEGDSTVLSRLEYKEDASVNYKVYQIDNSFYDEEYREEDKTYVANYVDKIVADFNYLVDYSDKITGSYENYVKAKMIVYNPDDESSEIWAKEYKLSDTETVNFVSDDSYRLSKTVDINFSEFLADYHNYSLTTGVIANAKLIVEFVCNNNGQYQELDDFSYGASLKLEFPLTDATFKIKKSSSVNDDIHKIIKLSDVKEDNEDIVFMRIIVILLWTLAVFTTIVLIIIIINDRRKLSYYEIFLRKILTAHDDVIVDASKLPSLTGFSVVDVTSFDELMDAQEEVNAPINFKEDKKKRIAKFVLVKDNLAWVYTLKESELE